MKPIAAWEVNVQMGWLVRPDFINKAVDDGTIEIFGNTWIVHAINKTTIAQNGDYIVQYEKGIAIYKKEFINSAREIFDIFKE